MLDLIQIGLLLCKRPSALQAMTMCKSGQLRLEDN